MTSDYKVRLRPLEREDLRFVHQLDNNASVMRYWFEEPYEAFVELSDLYDKHIHDQSERRFVVECDGENAGLVELVEINHVHRRAEFQIIISPEYQGKGLASRAAKLAMDYGFTVLNLYKLYLIVDKENEKAIHIYRKLGFRVEGELIRWDTAGLTLSSTITSRQSTGFAYASYSQLCVTLPTCRSSTRLTAV
ncbi:spermidine N1-acetyltransferase [Salmonella enterica subsp. enterica serovar Bareilly str. ATCC 9115]|nr:spermidine N1-acetyltransferase [Salmonella enterica subsp. enterica serovar Bareilly str. ATCC 9115]